LVVVCLGFGVALISTKRDATKQKEADTKTIGNLTNSLAEASLKLEEQRQVATMLQKDLDGQKQSFEKSVNELTNSISKVSADLAKSEASLKASAEEIKQRDAKISDLESQNQALDQKALKLSTAITNLTAQIADTQQRLATSQENKSYLEGQLKRLMTEKNELERQFSDLSVLRAQVTKLKEEMYVARRLDWTRQGLYANAEQKGAQKLMQGPGTSPAQARSAPKPVYDLNVEVSSDGSVRVLPSSNTNNAPGTAPSPPAK